MPFLPSSQGSPSKRLPKKRGRSPESLSDSDGDRLPTEAEKQRRRMAEAERRAADRRPVHALGKSKSAAVMQSDGELHDVAGIICIKI